MNRKLLYIVSPSYSGSTLLTILMADHPGIATVGELKASAFGDIASYKCSCGDLLTDCIFWREVDQRLADTDFDLLDWRTHFRPDDGLLRKLVGATLKPKSAETLKSALIGAYPPATRFLRSTAALNERIIDAACAIQGKATFLDGSKDPLRIRYLDKYTNTDTYLLVLIRDGRGVVNSHMKHTRASVDEACQEWLSKMAEVDRLDDWFDKQRIMEISYESLCEDPEATLADIYAFAHLPPHPVTLPLTPDERHLFGNDMRMSTVDAVRPDIKWRTELTTAALDRFEAIAGSVNAKLGYKPTE